ncbi:amino acid ABC transporter substrate-binding protein [Christensenella hongkongensis]|uniref:amino acid ABC transporter substrate-binding protein n=1 Tax=Christensenella hongkongensis TaxID=270498 RepID=UPI00267349D5|nr:amino acid ABC transporter substrate-binding protein [Christensenella hongkongensis]
MKKVLLIVLVIAFAAVCFVGCAPKTETSSSEASGSADASAAAVDDSLDKIKEKGEFVMGMDDSFPPMGFKGDDGELTGFDVEMAQAVAEHMGVKVNLQAIDWSAKEMELDAGNVDLLWNGYTITDERKEKVLMSEPYMENEQVIVVTKDSPVNTLADLAGKKVAVQDGSSAQEAIDGNEELKNSIAEQIDFKDNVTAMMDVSSGQVDALAVDLVVANYYLAKQPDQFRILDETLAPEEYGIGFRKGEEAFKKAVEEALAEMKKDGTAAEISTKWFGKDVTTF